MVCARGVSSKKTKRNCRYVLLMTGASLLVGEVCSASERETLSAETAEMSGYLETYYMHDFNRSGKHKRSSFTYSHNITGEPSVNLFLLKAAYSGQSFRTNLALAAGTYMRANYAAEPQGLQNLYEANVGLRLSESKTLWLDVGVMPSHIGFESAVGTENWTMTRGLMAENSPYFETGARVSYTTDDGKVFLSGLILNGWQRINSVNGNTTPSFGHQLVYKPNDRVTLNSSSFIGNDKSDKARQMRYFHNFYGQFKLNDQWSLIAAFDIGAEQKAVNSGEYNVWLAPAVIAKFDYSEKFSVSMRYEYFQDRNGVIIDTGTPNGFKTSGYSVNADYKLASNITLRNELRGFTSKDAIFEDDDGKMRKRSAVIGTSLAIGF